MSYPIIVTTYLPDGTSSIANAVFDVSRASLTHQANLFSGGMTAFTYTVLSTDVSTFTFNEFLVNGLAVGNANLRAEATISYILEWKDGNDNYVQQLPTSPMFTFTGRTLSFTQVLNSNADQYHFRITATLNGDATVTPIKDMSQEFSIDIMPAVIVAPPAIPTITEL